MSILRTLSLGAGLAACCAPGQPSPGPDSFEARVLSIEAGMTSDEVSAIMGPADGTTTSEGGSTIWTWSTRSMTFVLPAPRESTFSWRDVSVSFDEDGKVWAIHYDFRRVH